MIWNLFPVNKIYWERIIHYATSMDSRSTDLFHQNFIIIKMVTRKNNPFIFVITTNFLEEFWISHIQEKVTLSFMKSLNVFLELCCDGHDSTVYSLSVREKTIPVKTLHRDSCKDVCPHQTTQPFSLVCGHKQSPVWGPQLEDNKESKEKVIPHKTSDNIIHFSSQSNCFLS